MTDESAAEPGTDERAFLATLRPSRVREVQGGHTSWTQAHIIDVEAAAADALRSGLEAFRVEVRLTRVGQARHLVEALSTPREPYVVLDCHGDEGAIMLPRLADEVERYQPFHGPLRPDDLRTFARFDGAVVIATGCDTAAPELVRAVLDCGASAYIAPAGAPFGYASMFAPLFLFYELTELRSLDEAVDRLRGHDAELAMWQLHRP